MRQGSNRLRRRLQAAVAGVGLGIIAASVLTRLMTSLLFGTSPLDPLSFSLGPALLVVVGIAASLVPALRAAAIDPGTVLRGE